MPKKPDTDSECEVPPEVVAEDDGGYGRIRTFLGATRRTQTWHLPDDVDVMTIIGKSQFDLRDITTTGSEVVEISVFCLFGSVDFLVPEGTVVALDGGSFLAGARSCVAPGDGSDLPRLEIEATTILGRVRVRSIPDEEVEEIAAGEASPVEPPVLKDEAA